MKSIPKRRLAVLDYIRAQIAIHGSAPSYGEIAQACGFSSRAAARKHVVALAAAGLIETSPRKARSARLGGGKSPADMIRESTMFEVSVDHLRVLNDTELRELVAKLYQAAVVEVGHSPRHVTWGGDQNANDGGIDVRVKVPDKPSVADLPRPLTGFQVKAMSMPKSEIYKEMCPKGLLRPTIEAILRAGGCYIIVAAEDLSDSMLGNRVAAMRDAAATVGLEKAHLKFFDLRVLADLINRRPGVVAWVRERTGRPIQGWRPYGHWALGKGGSFIEDDALRMLINGSSQGAVALSKGLQRVRTMLSKGGQSIRLVGLSGVGKTRFVQALFESDVGEQALDEKLAVYTDTSITPIPTPLALVDEFVATKKRAIVVVDNCPAALHRQLTERCANASSVSLITIEYDITDDLPPESEVIRMGTGSPELIAKLINQQFPHVSSVDVSSICRLSDGNARVAIALASTIGATESGIRDEELFERLFWQKKQVSEPLLHAARACSLVYSFDGVNEANELPILAEVAGMSVSELYRHVETLRRRDLVQSRGVWRAVLPHAIANVLAKQALRTTLPSWIKSHLIEGEERLLRSFSRRIGFLSGDPEAEKLANAWLQPAGMLFDIAHLSDLHRDVLQNIAPIVPQAVLSAMEHAARGSGWKPIVLEGRLRSTWTRLLRSLAWEPDNFERCLTLLYRIAAAEPEDSRNDNTWQLVASLFQIVLSGTHASVSQREAWIRKGLASADPIIERLACRCLDSALKSSRFTSGYGFEFGTLSRDQGFFPRLRTDDTVAWFQAFVGVAVDFGTADSPLDSAVRKVFIRNLRGLLLNIPISAEMSQAVTAMAPLARDKLWLTVSAAIRVAGPKASTERLSALHELERFLKPVTMPDRIRAVVLSSHASGVDITEGDTGNDIRGALERAQDRARQLGEEAAGNVPALEGLLPELVENVHGRQGAFGFGLATACTNPAALWSALMAAFKAADASNRSVQLLTGFLQGLHTKDRELFETLLDNAVSQPDMLQWLPVLQTSVRLDARGVKRLVRAMKSDRIDAASLQYLAYGSSTKDLAATDLVDLVVGVSSKGADGLLVALDILSMHFYGEAAPADPAVVEAGIRLLAKLEFPEHNRRFEFHLPLLIKTCLAGNSGESSARALLERLRDGLMDNRIYVDDVNEPLEELMKLHPHVALDVLFGDDLGRLPRLASASSLEANDEERRNPLHVIAPSTLVAWCGKGPSLRWSRLAGVVPLFKQVENQLEWSDLVLSLLDHAPSLRRVLAVLVGRLAPSSWSGSRADIMAARLPLLDVLSDRLDKRHHRLIALCRARMEDRIAWERQWESQLHSQDHERFE